MFFNFTLIHFKLVQLALSMIEQIKETGEFDAGEFARAVLGSPWSFQEHLL